MTHSTGGSDGTIVAFPTTEEERRALRKAKQDQERQRLINCFVDEAGADQALFHDSDGTAFADLIIEGSRQTWPIRSKQFRFAYFRYLQRELDRLTDAGAILALALKSSLSKAAVNKAIDEFEMRAVCSQTEREVHVRVAGDGEHLYIDLCDPSWHAVRVTAAGWTIVQSPPVRFRHTSGMRALPFPECGTPITALRPFLNVRDESDFVLVIAFLLAALQPHGPYPILVLYGEQGSAKTNFARILRSLSDPSLVALSSLPSSGRDLFIAANNAHLQGFENVSKLSDALSDILCRLATGAGWRTRTLFKDVDETLFRGARPIVLEGIANFVTRGDLQDRSIILPLEPMSGYRTERELNRDFEQKRAGIFGALLDLLVQGVRMLPETRLARPPRMADFATWATACGLDAFESAFATNRQNAINVILEHDPLAQGVLALVVRDWRGTAQELLDELGPATRIRSTKAISDELRRLAPLLRTVGLNIGHERTAQRREIRISRSSA